MKLKQTLASLSAIAALTAAGAVAAAPITPTSTTFGTLTGATFGGDGIPNTAVAITEYTPPQASVPVLTLGLTAHQRCSGPNLASAAGVFQASAGLSTHGLTCAQPQDAANPFARWNIGIYVGGAGLNVFAFGLRYDFDPGTGTAEAAHGLAGPAFASQMLAIPGVALINDAVQASWNMEFDFLATTVPGLTAPAFTPFDPMANGEYTFALIAYAIGDGTVPVLTEVARSAIRVNVTGGTPVPVAAPGTLALAGLALLGLAGLQRRRSA